PQASASALLHTEGGRQVLAAWNDRSGGGGGIVLERGPRGGRLRGTGLDGVGFQPVGVSVKEDIVAATEVPRIAAVVSVLRIAPTVRPVAPLRLRLGDGIREPLVIPRGPLVNRHHARRRLDLRVDGRRFA